MVDIQQNYPFVGFYFKVIFAISSGIYESGFKSVSSYYPQIARYNELNYINAIEPGDELYLPSLKN